MKKKKFLTGVLNGNHVKKIFDYAKSNNFAIPAVNVFNSSTINSCLQIASYLNSPIIIQISYGGSLYNGGFSIKNKKIQKYKNKLAVASSTSLAFHVHKMSKIYKIPVILHTDHCSKNILPWLDGLIIENKKFYNKFNTNLFSSHMIDLSEENLNTNIMYAKKYLKILNNMNIFLEIELGVTGGEEDAIDNTNIEKSKLYTTPEEVYLAYKNFIKITNNFSIAAAFGNMHGVYKSGTIKLKPKILKNSQMFIKNKFNLKEKNPINFVFHGGSGSSVKDLKKSIAYGVVKVNIDTDLQYAFTQGVKNYMQKYNLYLNTQIGNNIDQNQPNKKYYDPRIWLKKGEKKFKKKLKKIFLNLNNINTLL